MRKINQLLVFVLLTMGVLISCQNQDNDVNSRDINDLKTVSFEKQKRKVINTKSTGKSRHNPDTGKLEFEYATTVEIPYLINPLLNPLKSNNDIIYPGSILRGETFLKGTYDPLLFEKEFNPIRVSVTLRGSLNPVDTISPTLSASRVMFNDIVTRHGDKIDFRYTTGLFEYDSQVISTYESFKKVFKLHASADILFGLVTAKFDYQKSEASSEKSNKVLVRFSQKLFNASMDSKHYSKWIEGGFDVSSTGKYEPLYVSSVDYGRMGYILVETTKTAEQTKKMISGAINADFLDIQVGADFESKQQFKKLFEEGKVKIMVNGGRAEAQTNISDIQSFFNFIRLPKNEELVKTSVPISYKIRRVRDNTEVLVYDTYRKIEYEYRED